MDGNKVTHSTRMRNGPLNSSTPKIKLSPRKTANQNLKNISFESDHTEPPSNLSPLYPSTDFGNCNDVEQKMTQIPTETQKKSTVTQAAPSVKKKNSSRRNSRSRSRGRHSRRPTPLRTLASQTIVKSESAEKLYPTAVRRSVRNTAKGDSVLFENLSLQTPVRAYETTYGTEKSRRLSSFIDHPYVLTFIYFLLCVLYAFIICKAVNYFGVDRFVMKHWIQWSKQIRSSMSS